MSKLFNDKLLSIDVSVTTWQEALTASCRKLIEATYVTEKYLEQLLNVVYDVGPYFILVENFAMPHVSATNEVMKTGLSITTLKEPVEFPNGKTVKVLFTFATTDSTSHLEFLQQLSCLLQVDNFVEKISEAKTALEIKNLLEES